MNRLLRAWCLSLLACGCGAVSPGSADGSFDGGRDDAGNTADAGVADSGNDDAGLIDSGDGGEDSGVDGGPAKSIQQWTVCDGVTDDALGAAAAFEAAKNHAFTLVVDCPVFIHVGTDISRAIFIEDETTVSFSGSGLFIVDNVLLPAFVLANTTGVTMRGWQVEYVGGLPIDPGALSGYYDDGGFVTQAGADPPGGAFNDLRLTPWLTAHRGVVFDQSQGRLTSSWVGPTNTSAVFFIVGDTSYVTVTGMKLFAPKTSGADRFVPMGFSITGDFRSNQTVNANTPKTSAYVAMPSHLTFSDIELDGTLMGWQGGGPYLTFDNIRSHRYADLQDADGGNVGGAGKWFAPPHLFYLNSTAGTDPLLLDTQLKISNVVDDGPRIGTARDRPGDGGLSGYALSLKVGAVDGTVDHYSSTRPDGLLDVLPSNNLKLSNIAATYDSSFLNGLFPGIRFPSTGYTQVDFEHVSLTDVAASSTQPPMGPANATSNLQLSAHDVHFTLQQWAGAGSLVPNLGGSAHDFTLDYALTGVPAAVEAKWHDTVLAQLEANPTSPHVGGSTTLSFSSKNASACVASGGWTGTLGASGTQVVAVTTPGAQVFGLECTGGTDGGVTSAVAVTVTVLP